MGFRRARALALAIIWAVIFFQSQSSEARSALDDFIESIQAQDGSLPAPDRLLEEIEKKALSSGSRIDISILPKGRSLVASESSLSSPRTVMTFEVKPSGNRIFVGYSPSRSELEISAEKIPGKDFEMAVIRSIGPGKRPEVKRSGKHDDLGACIACHRPAENPGLIWPPPPWTETTDNPKVLAALKGAAQSGVLKDPFTLAALRKVEATARKDHESGELHPSGALAIDGAVEKAHLRTALAPACASICGKDEECKRQLILLSLTARSQRLSAALKPAEALAAWTARLKALLPTRPSTESAFHLDPRDAMSSEPTLVLDRAEGRQIADRDPFLADGKLNPNFLEGGDPGPKAGPVDPKLPRASLRVPLAGLPIGASSSSQSRKPFAEEFLIPGVTTCLIPSAEQVTELERIDAEPLRSRLFADSTAAKTVLSNWPPTMEAVTALLKGNALPAVVASADCPPAAPLAPEMTEAERSLQRFREMEAALLLSDKQGLCVRCHSEEGGAPILPFDNLALLKTKTFWNGKTTWQRILEGEMPPRGSPERQAMEKDSTLKDKIRLFLAPKPLDLTRGEEKPRGVKLAVDIGMPLP